MQESLFQTITPSVPRKQLAGTYSGIGVALAWPYTYCKQAGAWYDKVMQCIGWNKNHYYQVGHAALLLIEEATGNCHYFDFGRYHAPFGYGRVRSAYTDSDLQITRKAQIVHGKWLNAMAILQEVASNTACHGSGKLMAGWAPVRFECAMQTALNLQRRGSIPYGPFRWSAINCSRFVRSVLLSGQVPLRAYLPLLLPFSISASPVSNVLAMPHRMAIETAPPPPPQAPATGKNWLKQTLPAPLLPEHLPRYSQWLAGEGAGSWFVINALGSGYKVARYSPEGVLECKGIFEHGCGPKLNTALPYSIGYLSHCQQVVLWQNRQEILLRRLH